MTETIKFIPPRVPLVNVRDGLITREWYLLFQSLFTGFGAADDDALLIAPVAPVDMLLDQIGRLIDDERQRAAVPVFVIGDLQEPPPLPPGIVEVLALLGSVRDEVAMLRSAIDDLQKGPL